MMKLRAHHLLCLSRFIYAGWYSKEYGKNFKKIFSLIKKNSEVKILVNLGIGSESDKVWTCDLNEEYIKINKDYRS